MSLIGDRFNYRQLGTGAIRYCLNKQGEMVENLDNTRLADQIREALGLNKEAGHIELEWKNERDNRSTARNEAAAVDDKLDRTLSSLHDVIVANAKLDTECRQRALAREMRDELFPAGVYPVTSSKYDEQYMHIADLLELIDASFTEHVEALGIEAMVESLRELNATFGEQLDLANDEQVTFDDVREARRKGREAFHKVIAMILGDYANQPDIREQLLAPVEAQDERVAREYRRQGEARDVDPETGDPTGPDGPSGDGESEETSDGDPSDGTSGDDSSDELS